jgi:hypothetical protein
MPLNGKTNILVYFCNFFNIELPFLANKAIQDPDPGGKKTYGSCGSGSGALLAYHYL